MKKINSCITICLILAFTQVSWANPKFERCGNLYIEAFYKSVFNMTEMIDLDQKDALLKYDSHLRFYGGNHFAAFFSYVYTVAMTPVALPIVGAMSVVKNRIISKYDFIGQAILDPESFAGEPGMEILYEQVEDEIQISESEFFEFFLNQYDRSRLCGAEERLALSERGQAMVGHDNFILFMREVHRTPQWKDFWEDERNFEMRYDYGAKHIDNVKSQLIHDLIQAGYRRID